MTGIAPGPGEGTSPTPLGRTWYKVFDGTHLPLVVVHGGPGLPHDYLIRVAGLAPGPTVVFYDQLGCGKSDPLDEANWNVPQFVDELASLVQHLGFRRFAVLGHSWGSIVAMEFALRRPPGLSRLVLGSPTALARPLAQSRD